MKLKYLFLATFLIASNGSQAADLLQTYHAAQANDPVFAAARATEQAGKEKLPQGRSLLLPTINLTANSTFNNQDATFSGSTLNNQYNSNGYNVSLVQPLFRQQNWMGFSESKLQAAQAEAQLKIAEQDLIVRVAQAYFDVLIAQDSVDLSKSQKVAISEQLEQAKRNFDVGTATITDTLEAQSRFDQTSAQEIAARNDLEIKRSALQQLINAAPGELSQLGKELKLEIPQPPDMKVWEDNAQQNNLQLDIAKASAEIADREVARNRGGNYPTIDLVANYSRNKNNGNAISLGLGLDVTNRSVGVQLNMPLYEGGAINSKWREAEANLERSKQELENTRRSVVQQTRQAYLGVVSGVSQVQALQQALASSQSVLDASKLGQEVGVRTNLDVLNAQQALTSTQRDLYLAQYNYLLSELRLKQAVGSLGEADLAKVNQALH